MIENCIRKFNYLKRNLVSKYYSFILSSGYPFELIYADIEYIPIKFYKPLFLNLPVSDQFIVISVVY